MCSVVFNIYNLLCYFFGILWYWFENVSHINFYLALVPKRSTWWEISVHNMNICQNAFSIYQLKRIWCQKIINTAILTALTLLCFCCISFLVYCKWNNYVVCRVWVEGMPTLCVRRLMLIWINVLENSLKMRWCDNLHFWNCKIHYLL